ncbi:MAG TPA: hydroxyisourate hydrolase [Puia sp.]|nr:hydroxyisourate hydrolase [Puia sp.]
MSTITTHILDISQGRPASGVEVILYTTNCEITRSRTNSDGRITGWDANVGPGVYTLRFETKHWYESQSIPTFYPYVEIHFEITAVAHYHIPLLISPWGYSTYRGS